MIGACPWCSIRILLDPVSKDEGTIPLHKRRDLDSKWKLLPCDGVGRKVKEETGKK